MHALWRAPLPVPLGFFCTDLPSHVTERLSLPSVPRIICLWSSTEAAFSFHIIAPYQLGPLQSPSLVSFLGNILVLCALWEDGSPALFLPTGTGTVPLSLGPVTSLCIWRKGLQEALFSSLTVRGHLVRSILAARIQSFLVSVGGRLSLGLKRRRGLITNMTPTVPDFALWLLFHCMICMDLLENTKTSRNC